MGVGEDEGLNRNRCGQTVEGGGDIPGRVDLLKTMHGEGEGLSNRGRLPNNDVTC